MPDPSAFSSAISKKLCDQFGKITDVFLEYVKKMFAALLYKQYMTSIMESLLNVKDSGVVLQTRQHGRVR